MKQTFVQALSYRNVFVTIVWISIGILIGQLFPKYYYQFRVDIKSTDSISTTNGSLKKNCSPDNIPLLFIGGHESSGTGLMRIQMDAHPWIRCGAEPMITQEVLLLWRRFGSKPDQRTLEAGIYPQALNEATKAYIRETIIHMGPPAKILCHKQPMTFYFLKQLGEFFPDAKFIHMVRDGRGAVTSSINRGLTKSRAYNQSLLFMWERIVSQILNDCRALGKKRCINVRYESLILRTEQELRRILKFLNVPWDPIVLKHETILKNITNLNPYEPSTAQFTKAIYKESLLKWSKPNSPIPLNVLNDSCKTIKLLNRLNYCPSSGFIPDYATIPSEIVLN